MRKSLILLPLLLGAAPAAAAPAPQEASKIPPQLLDPHMADRLADTSQSLTNSLLDLRVGEVRAAIEGRSATTAEKTLTVRELGRRDDPHFDRDVRERIAHARPVIERGMKAMVTALPAIEKAVEDAGRAIDRAAANMPDPTYPKR
jgi:hypothetical protein